MLKYSFDKAFKPIFVLLSIAFLTSGTSWASEESDAEASDAEEAHGHEKSEEAEAFNAGDMIMHHVTDAHDIHLMDIGNHAVSIPLPMILLSTDDGLSVFLSSAFHHGHAAKNRYILEHNHVYRLGETNPFAESEELHAEEALSMGYTEESWGGYFAGEPGAFIDLSLTKTATGILITVLIMFLVFMSIAKSYARNPNEAPTGLQSLMEPMILFIRDEVAKPSIGPKYERFMPYLLTVFFFIWTANMLGLIPFIGGFNITGNLAATGILALITFIITNVSGNKYYWKHIFAPGVPVALYPLMIPIEVMGLFIKPIVLCARLFANMTAGHIIILSFMSLIFIFANLYGSGAGFGVSVVSLAFAIFMNILEILVAFLQAYVFTLLSALYFGAAVEEHH
ncbi:MAG: F0F1 ATP synthase subunit A [Flavobacteriales bacterium]|nr:F0F1 ATP synthase subunit A [Flavobacteriales bacterium]